MKNNLLFDSLIQEALAAGATRAAIIDAKELHTDASFREMCAANACGMYGRCYMCPPDVGEIEDLMRELSRYAHVLVYQRVSPLEDSFDFEGMQVARRTQYRLSQKIRTTFEDAGVSDALHLSAGGCGVCTTCAKQTNEPCRFPDRAMASLEVYGIYVSEMARSAGMKYINGENTVTYFGAVLFNKEDNDGNT